MRRAQFVLLLAATLALSMAPASWSWKLSVFSMLAVTFMLILRATASSASNGVVRLFRDNTAMLSTVAERRVFASLGARHWVSPWFCSVAIHPARGGGKRYLVICASGNDPDEYRRLLQFLRMRPGTSETEKMVW